MAKTEYVQVAGKVRMPVLYEDRAVLAIDKPAGWMLAPDDWGGRNLQAALEAALVEGPFWVRQRGLRFLRYVHRLDAETTGVLLLVKSRHGLKAYSALFETRQITKRYLAVVTGKPPGREWICRASLAPDPMQPGRMRADPKGKQAETRFVVLKSNHATGKTELSLVEAQPVTGRTHQIRVHLAEARCPIVGDRLYGKAERGGTLALRAVALNYTDPFSRKRIEIRAPEDEFVRGHGF